MNINVKIAEIKDRVKGLTRHFPYNEFEINIITICYIAIASIDNDITDIIDEMLAKEFILFHNGNFDEVLTKLKAPLKSGGFHRCADFDEYKRGNYEFIGINLLRTYVFRTMDLRILLEYVLHEIKHGINSVIHSYQRHPEGVRLHVGLSECDLDENEYRSMWEEVFNDFLTKIYLIQVDTLREMDIEDLGIREILDNFFLEPDILYGYNSTELCSVIFNDIDVFRIFYNAALYKDYEPFYEVLQSLFSRKLEGENLPPAETVDYLDGLLASYQNTYNRKIENYFKDNTSEYPKNELSLKPHFEHI